MKIFDITLPLRSDLPVWPGSFGFSLTWSSRIEMGNKCNNSHIQCDTHTGTHVDAPLHFIEKGQTVEKIPLKTLIGSCFVAYLPDLEKITAENLTQINIPQKTKRLLLRTNNSMLWSNQIDQFSYKYVYLSSDAARWVVNRKISLIGIDYISIGKYNAGYNTHKIMLNENIVIIEGLNLSQVLPGEYELICLPLKLEGAEGAPARALLRR